MSDTSVCRCDAFVHPKPIANPPGRPSISYRGGDYAAFRHALLTAPSLATGLPAEIELSQWRPSAEGDLALQMIEWWAYLADILTFYNERHAGESYLGTARLPESVSRLIRVLGYRPRPGIGATATLAALVNGPIGLTLPQGFQIQSKAGPGNAPQIFELDADTILDPADSASAEAPPATQSLLQTETIAVNGVATAVRTVLVKGVSTTVKKGDELLIVQRGDIKDSTEYALARVVLLSQVKDARGKLNTKLFLTFPATPNLPANASFTDYQLMKSRSSAHVWMLPANTVITSSQVDLDSLTREISVTDPILFEITGSSPTVELTGVKTYQEVVWYANPKGYPATANPDPSIPPEATDKVVPIPIPHTRVTFTRSLATIADTDRSQVLVRYGWYEAGEFIAVPAATVSAAGGALSPSEGAAFPSSGPALVEDAKGNGATASVTSDSTIQLTAAAQDLTPPLRALFNLLSVSRGQTVSGEILGSGDGTVPGQEFVLQKSPVTYLLDVSSQSGNNYKSTLQIWVDSVLWTEAASFYGQPPGARVFITREDENAKTHVAFGDGINGARLPTATNNVVATYRYGSGKSAPDTGTLTTVLNPRPHLKAIRNPVAAGGGADPDPADQIRRYAPQSVLTFGRAVSADDYETIAAQAPGVARARSYWTWDDTEQRSVVKVYVGDDSGAVGAARAALAGAADPNRPILVAPASASWLFMYFALLISPTYDPAAVVAAVTSALIDPDAGLLGINVARIGASLFNSQIYEACLSVPGAIAVHGLFVEGNWFGTDYRYDPGEGGYFKLTADTLDISYEVAADAR